VHQDAEVLAIDAEVAADGIFITGVEEQPAENLAVLLGHFGEDLADGGAVLLVDELGFGVDGVGGAVVGRFAEAGDGAIEFEQHVVADGVDERAEGLRISDCTLLTEGLNDTQESLLLYVLYEVGGAKARAELDGKQLTEIRREIPLRLIVCAGKPLQIEGVKALTLHSVDYTARKVEGLRMARPSWRSALLAGESAGESACPSTSGEVEALRRYVYRRSRISHRGMQPPSSACRASGELVREAGETLHTVREKKFETENAGPALLTESTLRGSSEEKMGTPINAKVNFEPTVQRLLRRASKEQLARLVETAAATSGEVVSKTGFDPGDDTCPTFRFPHPLPPRFNSFLDEAASMSGMIRLFPYGILAPDGILVQVNMGRIAE
jgi:hypothetical protein